MHLNVCWIKIHVDLLVNHNERCKGIKKKSLSLNVQTNPCITTSQTVRKLSIYKNWPQRHKKIPQ